MKSSHSQFHNNSVWDFHANIGVLVPGQSWGTRVTHWQYYVSGLDCGTAARKTDGSVKLHIFILAYAPCEVVLFLTRTKFKNTSVSFMVLTIFHLCSYWIYMFKMKMSLEEMSWLWAMTGVWSWGVCWLCLLHFCLYPGNVQRLTTSIYLFTSEIIKANLLKFVLPVSMLH